jgi:indole-3-glycerol phosphate synthase
MCKAVPSLITTRREMQKVKESLFNTAIFVLLILVALLLKDVERSYALCRRHKMDCILSEHSDLENLVILK